MNAKLKAALHAHLSELGRQGARTLYERTTPAERRAKAKHAAEVRWAKKRAGAKP